MFYDKNFEQILKFSCYELGIIDCDNQNYLPGLGLGNFITSAEKGITLFFAFVAILFNGLAKKV